MPDPYECDLRGAEIPGCPQYDQAQYDKVLAATLASNVGLPDAIRRKLMGRMSGILRRGLGRSRAVPGAVSILLTAFDVNQLAGAVGEYLVGDLLVEFGFEIIGHQVTAHTPLGDRRLDFVVHDPVTGKIFAVEVKTISDVTPPLGFIAVCNSSKIRIFLPVELR